MDFSFSRNYYVYIATDKDKSILEVGIAGDLNICFQQLEQKLYKGGKVVCAHPLYWEKYKNATQALSREKELNKMSKRKRIELIEKNNPEWQFLNGEVLK